MKEDDGGFINLDETEFGDTIRGHQPGDHVFEGRFRLSKLVGRGGMGVVWLAEDQRLENREVALKFTPESIRFDDVAVDDLKRETLRGLELAHPNIVRFFDFLIDDRFAAISMEFVDGATIGRLRTQEPAKVFEPRGVEPWISQLLAALEYAHHTAQIVHRDLKPANLLINQDNNLKITDFGIAASISEALVRVSNQSAALVGTLVYMSPQQARGEPARLKDDIYSLGCTLYEFFTGKPPFFSGNIALQIEDEIPPPISVRRAEFGIENAEPFPAMWDEVIHACLEKKVENRPSSAAEIATALGIQNLGPSRKSGHSATAQSGVASDRTIEGLSTGTLGGDRERTVVVRSTEGPLETLGGRQEDSTRPQLSKKVLALIAGGVALAAAAGAAFYGLRGDGDVVAGTTEPPKDDEVVETTPPLDKTPGQTSKPEPGTDQPSEPETTIKVADTTNNKKDLEPTPKPPPPKPPAPKPGPQTKFTVPGKFATIKEAIQNAKAGDIITVADGTYEEHLTLKDGIHLKAQTAGKVTIQVNSEIASHLTVQNCKSASVEGFRFIDQGMLALDPAIVANKTKVNPAVHIISSTVELRQCKFSGRGDGVLMTGSGSPKLTDCEAINNTLSGYLVTGSCRVNLERCLAQSNGDHGITVTSNSDAILVDCVFTENDKSGVYLEVEGTATLKGSRSEKNREAGILLMNGGNSLKMERGAVSENELEGFVVYNDTEPGAIILGGGSNLVDLSNVDIAGNKKHGIVLFSPKPGSRIEKCRVTGNSGYGIGVAGEDGDSIIIATNTISGNVHGIYAEGEGMTATITSNPCSGNATGIWVVSGVLGKVEGNDCRGNTDGLILDEPVAGLTVENNQQ